MTILRKPSDVTEWIKSLAGARIIGIVGPPGSGKSTFAKELSEHLSVPHCVVPMDGFHYPQETLRALGRRERMGAPDTFDTEAGIANAVSVPFGASDSTETRAAPL